MILFLFTFLLLLSSLNTISKTIIYGGGFNNYLKQKKLCDIFVYIVTSHHMTIKTIKFPTWLHITFQRNLICFNTNEMSCSKKTEKNLILINWNFEKKEKE